ncbi:MAG: nickel-dependent hydrogenase large subunit [Proteobacteria bacterium]|nr:nickel-dependent hydrogenase large subunit [Pseudomonadota bacterium]
MARTIDIDPITRIEGHLAIRVEVESGKVVSAYSAGEMFRGFEQILTGRDPLDAQQITQRICGVCPVSHGMASVQAQEEAYGVSPPSNGRIIRNIILAANYIQSHIIHFYHLSALDFVDIAKIAAYTGKDPALLELKDWVNAQLSSKSLYPAAPFLPRYDSNYIENTELNILAIKHYLDALSMRALAHKLGAIFAGKLPHTTTIVPGGVTEIVTAKKIAACLSMMKTLQSFIDHSYVPDVIAVASAFPEYFNMGKGYGNFLGYGVFPENDGNSNHLFSNGAIIDGQIYELDPMKITEDVAYSLFSSESGLSPDLGRTEPAPEKHKAYSWIKAPRYGGKVMEVGSLARLMISHKKGRNPVVTKHIDALLARTGLKPDALISAMGRHAARAIESQILAERCIEWIENLNVGKPVFNDFEICKTGRGVGLTEAPRGALGHWINIENYKIANYQCVVPTTWNCSPRDDRGIPGAVEFALIGTPVTDEKNPMAVARVVRSFDPCIACAVH